MFVPPTHLFKHFACTAWLFEWWTGSVCVYENSVAPPTNAYHLLHCTHTLGHILMSYLFVELIPGIVLCIACYGVAGLPVQWGAEFCDRLRAHFNLAGMISLALDIRVLSAFFISHYWFINTKWERHLNIVGSSCKCCLTINVEDIGGKKEAHLAQ